MHMRAWSSCYRQVKVGHSRMHPAVDGIVCPIISIVIMNSTSSSILQNHHHQFIIRLCLLMRHADIIMTQWHAMMTIHNDYSWEIRLSHGPSRWLRMTCLDFSDDPIDIMIVTKKSWSWWRLDSDPFSSPLASCMTSTACFVFNPFPLLSCSFPFITLIRLVADDDDYGTFHSALDASDAPRNSVNADPICSSDLAIPRTRCSWRTRSEARFHTCSSRYYYLADDCPHPYFLPFVSSWSSWSSSSTTMHHDHHHHDHHQNYYYHQQQHHHHLDLSMILSVCRSASLLCLSSRITLWSLADGRTH